MKTIKFDVFTFKISELENVKNVFKSLKFYIFKNVKFDNFVVGVFAFYDVKKSLR